MATRLLRSRSALGHGICLTAPLRRTLCIAPFLHIVNNESVTDQGFMQSPPYSRHFAQFLPTLCIEPLLYIPYTQHVTNSHLCKAHLGSAPSPLAPPRKTEILSGTPHPNIPSYTQYSDCQTNGKRNGR